MLRDGAKCRLIEIKPGAEDRAVRPALSRLLVALPDARAAKARRTVGSGGPRKPGASGRGAVLRCGKVRQGDAHACAVPDAFDARQARGLSAWLT